MAEHTTIPRMPTGTSRHPAPAEERFSRGRDLMEEFHRGKGSSPGLETGSACFGLGSARLRDGRPADAIEPLTCAVRISPRDAKPLEALAEALTATGRHQEAEQMLTRVVALRPGRFGPYFDLASLMFQRGDAAAALAMAAARHRVRLVCKRCCSSRTRAAMTSAVSGLPTSSSSPRSIWASRPGTGANDFTSSAQIGQAVRWRSKARRSSGSSAPSA